jgi:DHA1 family bicyclomycin/chloramphenicol resistance-like MFS transporter
VAEILRHPVAGRATLVQAFCFAPLFLTLSTTHQVFDQYFDRAAGFPLWFGLIALLSGTASLLNASLVGRLGMRYLVRAMLGAQIVLTALYCLTLVALPLGPNAAFAVYVLWTTGVFFQAGLTLGNLNALAMEPMGHLAGLAASVIGSVATVASVALAAPIGLMFDGTPRIVAFGTLALVIAAWLAMAYLNRAAET